MMCVCVCVCVKRDLACLYCGFKTKLFLKMSRLLGCDILLMCASFLALHGI